MIEPSKYHDEISSAVTSPHNTQRTNLETKDITRIVELFHPHITFPENSIQPADHCENHTNKSSCDCSKTNNSIFKKVGQSQGRGRGFIYDVR